MTKFKVGDRVKNISNGCYELGAIGVITDIDESENIQTSFHSQTGGMDGYYWAYTDWMEIIKPSPKTYTLTPYIKPDTVTINGVEYIMTENA